MDRFGNGRGKEGYVKRKRVWRISTRPKFQLGKKVQPVKREENAKELTEEMTEENVEQGDELMEVLGLDPTPIETAALP